MFAVLVQALIAGVVALLPRILAGLGVYFIADSVSAPIFQIIQSRLFQNADSLPYEAVNAIHFAGIFDAVIIIISAYITVLSIKAGKAAFVAR